MRKEMQRPRGEHGLRQDDGVDGNELQEVSTTRRAGTQRAPSHILCRIGNISKNRWQPRRDGSHDYPNDISVVPDFTSALSIYGVPGDAQSALAGELTSP